ncbi:hypothetical protein ACLI4U_05320 [Natrialbaceae archaeon A-CW2]|uniref:hypothetical protein n=1 Tax=Natronosalvus amylolyticus TaxID=2961994 RepID=UPI0020C9B33B|nr:hypothetical protein [Natronosalvus amylolyticus]
MDVPAQRNDPDPSADIDTDPSLVTCHETRPGKIVLTEKDNSDAWIAADVSLELRP